MTLRSLIAKVCVLASVLFVVGCDTAIYRSAVEDGVATFLTDAVAAILSSLIPVTGA